MIETVAKLVQHAPTFSIAENGSTIHDYFEQNENAEGVVLIDGEKPAGIIMRNDFYQKVGRQYGYTIYMRRNIALIMKHDIVCVDISCDMAKLGFIAMNRSKESLYDHIIVLENDRYAGVISISEFLMEMSRTKEREIELLNKQQAILKQANEAEKQHRMEIERKNYSIKNLLDNAGQGFLSFGGDLAVSGEYSRECEEIFEAPICGRSFPDIIREHTDDGTVSLMQDAFQAVFREDNKARSRAYLSILPQEIAIRQKYIKIEYKVINNPNEKSIMIILTNITEKKALELKNAEEKRNVKLIIRAISCKEEINQAIADLRDFFTQGARSLLGDGKDMRAGLYAIYRKVHTMKGDFSLNSLHNTSSELHKLEDVLADMTKGADTVSMEDITGFLDKINCDSLLEKDAGIIAEALGPRFFEKDDTFKLSGSRLAEVEEQIGEAFRGDEKTRILRLFDSLLYPNIKDILRDYNDYTRAAAERLGKKLKDFEISGHDVYISRSMSSQFAKSFAHIFRNIADHGIEAPDERIDSGKPEAGMITCDIKKYEDKFVLSICDDGKGIDTEAVKRKAVEKGIYTEPEINCLSEEEILGIIFHDSFSTKNTVDMLSGRGIGLAAVQSAVAESGGTVRVDTQAGKYTRFEFAVPLSGQ